MNDQELAQIAYSMSHQNERDISAHEDLCAERYGNINKSISEIKGILKWSGTTAFGIIIALLGWSISQQMSANNQAALASQAKIDLLQRQINVQPSAHSLPQEITGMRP